MTGPPTGPILQEAAIDPQGRSQLYADIYHAAGDALAEKRQVFPARHDLPGRWRERSAGGGGCFTLLELGFGLGLNFLLTAEAWRASPHPGLRLHYLAIEKHPVPRDRLRATLAGLDLDPGLRSMLLRDYPRPLAGIHRLHLSDDLCLTLLYLDVSAALDEIRSPVDAIYLDGFSPKANPAMWDPGLWPRLARVAAAGASLSTYSAAGAVRRGLAEAGFEVWKETGHGAKREALAARWPGPGLPAPGAPASIAIIGGGLAGCCCAWALGNRGLRAVLFEAGPSLMSGTSGMPQLAYSPQLARNFDPQHRFSLTAFQYLQAYLRSGVLAAVSAPGRSGMLRLVNDADLPAAGLLEQQYGPAGLARLVDPGEAMAIAGVPIRQHALHHRDAGWLDPVALAAAQHQAPAEPWDLRLNQRIASLQQVPGGWLLGQPDGRSEAFEAVILAAGFDCLGLPEGRLLPIQPLRGQSALAPRGALARLDCIVAGAVGVFPAHRDRHLVTATYQPGARSRDYREHDHRLLTERFRAQFDLPEAGLLPGPVGIRAAARDRCPIVGPLADRARLIEHYRPLARNGRLELEPFAEPRRGLYACTAFGSHGMTLAPLAAEYLASLICGDPSPIERGVEERLSPNRFVITDLRRHRID